MSQKAWQFEDAKDRFEELIDNATSGQPQVVMRDGKKAVVVISYEQFDKWSDHKRTFIDVLLSAPRVLDESLDTTMECDTMRDIDLS